MRHAHPEAEEERPRIGPDQELQSLQTVLAINFKDERRVRVVDGIWCLADQAGKNAAPSDSFRWARQLVPPSHQL